MKTIFNTAENHSSPITGKEYSISQIRELGIDYYRKDNSGPHTKQQACELFDIDPKDFLWIINLYNNLQTNQSD